MEYRFEQMQMLRFEVYDIDDADGVLDEQDSIGFLECTVANIVAAGAKGFIHTLESDEIGAKTGTIILIAEELASLKDEVQLLPLLHSVHYFRLYLSFHDTCALYSTPMESGNVKNSWEWLWDLHDLLHAKHSVFTLQNQRCWELSSCFPK